LKQKPKYYFKVSQDLKGMSQRWVSQIFVTKLIFSNKHHVYAFSGLAASICLPFANCERMKEFPKLFPWQQSTFFCYACYSTHFQPTVPQVYAAWFP